VSLGKRNVGLDYFRTLAIAFVLLSHSRHLFTYIDGVNWWLLSVGGYLGVELFFVLSGFLIGRILIEKVLLVENKVDAFKNFLLRRWFRTLPLYYLILCVYVVVVSLQQKSLFFSWNHLFFLQNFDSKGLEFFAVSWSLSVEEWFYLFMPVLLALTMSFVDKTVSQKIFLSIVSLLIIISFVKLSLVYMYPEWTWTDVRKNIFLRFDSLLIGVMVAYIQGYHREKFNLLGSRKVFVGSILFMIGMVAWYYYQGDSGLSSDFFSKSLMFPITSILLSIIMLYFYFHIKRESILSLYGSRLAYSIYLIHFLFLDYFIQVSHQYQDAYLSVGFLLLFLCLTVGVSYVLYRFYELPVMNLRERFAPN